MRFLIAIFLLAALIKVGWSESYRNHYYRLAGKALPGRQSGVVDGKGSSANSRSAVAIGASQSASPQPASDPSWMWERSKLDRPIQAGEKSRQ
jgi:hypothetical protein